jgi:hypothetical protein
LVNVIPLAWLELELGTESWFAGRCLPPVLEYISLMFYKQVVNTLHLLYYYWRLLLLLLLLVVERNNTCQLASPYVRRPEQLFMNTSFFCYLISFFIL